MNKILLLLSALTLILISESFSQVTTSSMSGVVTDKAGQVLPGASVIAVHEPTGTPYGVATLNNGRFTIPNMRIGGPYKVTISFIGFEGVEKTGIYLSLGEEFVLNVELSEDVEALSEVVIKGDNLFISDKTGASTQIDNETIKKMPTITRSAQDIYRLNPASDGNSFAGRNNQFNNFSLDGSIFNNPFGLDAATPGGQTDAQPVSLDAIDQIQVSIAPYDITQAGFTGAAVNAVTKSGTNQFKGTVFGFYRTDELTGSKVDGEEIFVPELTQLQTGFSLGGPIIKNKLFFFANMEIERRQDLGSGGWVANNNDGTTAINESRVLASDLIAVRDALAGLGYETGAYEGYTHNTDNQKGIFKLDWNINSKHSLTATYNFLDASKDKPANPNAIGRRGPDATTLQFFNSGYQITNKIQSGSIEVRSLFGNRFSNKFQAGVTAFRDSRNPFSAPAPVININRDGVRYIVAGHEPFSINNRLDQNVYQATNNFSIYAGDHTVTVGASFERFDFDNSFNLGIYDPSGYPAGTFGPGFSNVSDFLAYVDSGSMASVFNYADSTFESNNSNNAWALAETNLGQFALYAQDEWSISRDFTLTYGVRMDMPLYFNTEEKIRENIERKGGTIEEGGTYAPDVTYYDKDGNSVFLNSTDLPKRTPLISPRIGFNYNMQGLSKTLLRGGTGLFTGRLPFVWIGNQVANPDFFFYTMTDRDFQFPQVWRSNVGVEHTLESGLTFSTDLIFTKDLNAMIVRNYGLRTPEGELEGVDNRLIYRAEDRAEGPFGGTTNAYVFTNSDQGYSFNWIIEAKKSWNNGLFASLAYNFLEAQEVSSIAAEISGDAYDRNPALGNVNNPSLAPSLYGNRHRFVGLANKTFVYGKKWATTISIFAEYSQGGRFSYTYSGDINNDGSGLNDLLYIPTEAEIQQMQFDETNASQAAQRTAFNSFIEQDEYLSENRGSYAERYAALSPWVGKIDLRLLQDYKLPNDHVIQFSLDVINFGNLLNSSWGVRQFPQNTQPVGVSVNNAEPTYSFDTNLESTFVSDFSLNSRWQIQLGLRYSF